MSPAQIARLNYWGPIMAFVASGALTAGVAYGIMGSDVARNSSDIKELKTQGETLTKILVAQGVASSERGGLKSRLDLVSRILERQYGIPSGD